jgi:hypothetical protein
VNLTNISRRYLGINKMKIDLTTGTWQDNPGCPINITLVSTSDAKTWQINPPTKEGDKTTNSKQ